MRLIVPTIGSHMQQNLKLCFAKAVVIDGLSLNVFELKKELNQAIKLLNNKFQLSIACEIRENLLSDKFCFYLLYIMIYTYIILINFYKAIQKKITSFLQINFNFITDEFSNI